MKRWYLYALIGLIFGIFDWFYLDWLGHGLSRNLGENPFIVKPIVLGLNYGIWLVPIIPVTLYEASKAKTIKAQFLPACSHGAALFSVITSITPFSSPLASCHI